MVHYVSLIFSSISRFGLNLLSFTVYYHNPFHNAIVTKAVSMAAVFEPKKDTVEYENKSVRLPKKLIDSVQTLADANDMSFNKLVIQCIEFALQHLKSDS